LPNPIKHGNTVSLPLMPTYATNAKPSSETTQDKENTVSLCSSRKNDTEKCDRKLNYRAFITEQILAAVTVA
jgi:hypothetical protein